MTHREKSDIVLALSLFLSLCPSHSPRQCRGDSEVHRGQTRASVSPSFVYTETERRKKIFNCFTICRFSLRGAEEHGRQKSRRKVPKNTDSSFRSKKIKANDWTNVALKKREGKSKKKKVKSRSSDEELMAEHEVKEAAHCVIVVFTSANTKYL